MKRYTTLMTVSIILLLLAGKTAQAQSEATTPVGSLNIVKEVKPPILQMVGQVAFSEPSGNRAIDAGEHCKLSLKVKNTGMGDGYGLVGRIRAKSRVSGVTVRDVTLPTLKVGETYTVEFPLEADMRTEDGMADYFLSIEEPNGFNLPEVPVTVATRAFQAPMVEFRGHIVENGALTLAKNTPYTMQVLVQNTGRGTAEQVNVSLVLPEGVYQLDEEDALRNAQMTSGQSHTIKYTFIVPQNYSRSTLPVTIRISELYGKYSKNGQISFDLREQTVADRTAFTPIDNSSEEIVVASLGSDVDRDIPSIEANNSTLHVMIVANQNYRKEQPVSTALSDGRMTREYCVRTLGVPEKNVQLLEDRTSAEMQAAVEDFARTIRYNPNDRFIFFYFGHGMRDQDATVADAYLMPVDGSSLRLQQTGISRNWMMRQFEQSKPNQLVVYLESCFSGATESDQMLKYGENSSGLRLVDDVKTTFAGNIILLTASSQSQTANAYPRQHHNVFTYEFLKALKNSKGNVNWGQLFDDVKRNTTRTAWNELARDQEPSIVVSTTLGDAWKKWSVK